MHSHIQTVMPKGVPLMEQDILKLPRKTLFKPASHSSDFALVTRRKFDPFALFYRKKKLK